MKAIGVKLAVFSRALLGTPIKTIFAENREMRIGAGERNRTPDRLITNQLLYLLSYAS